jgi:hypothetical protein
VTFAQDLFLDAAYQRRGGGWLDFSDVPTVQLLSAEMSVDVTATQSLRPTEPVEEGGSYIFILPLAVN